MLGKDTILGVDDLKREVVDVPEWGGQVTVREFTGTERDRLEKVFMAANGAPPDNLRAMVCTLSIVDEAGKRLFTDADIEALGAKSFTALDRVFAAAMELNGMVDGSVEDAEKN